MLRMMVIHCGALERHPSLRIVLGESGIGWIPYVLERMDEEWEGRYRERLGMKMKPSEYWRRQCYVGASAHSTRAEIEARDKIGVRNIMWGSDYPHPEGTWPASAERTREMFFGLYRDYALGGIDDRCFTHEFR
mgnify:CR=1 FL=1